MKQKIFSWAFAAAAILLFCVPGHAVTVTNYNDFQNNLSSGNNVELTTNDIIKASTNTATITIPATTLTITGNSRIIDINKVGNMFTMSNNNTIVNMSTFTVIRGSHTSNGGAINITGAGSQLNISGTSNFTSNFSNLSGGAISVSNNSSINFTGNAKFSENSANSHGGAIYLTGSGTADFSGAVLNAVNNRSNRGNGGFLAAVNAGNITFGEARFENNTSARSGSSGGFGGAIYSSGNTNINFTGNVNFLNNSAYSAGAMYISTGTTATFSGTSTIFENNSSIDEVGALLVRHGASVIFQGETTSFINNHMVNNVYGTGAVDMAYNASGDFTGTYLVARGNNAGNGGLGGFMWVDRSNVNIGKSLIGGPNLGDGNTAYYGGGIYAGNSSNVTFSGTETVFRNNRAYADGGALYITTNSVVTFNTGSSTMTVFQNNVASGKGGAAAVTGAARLYFNGDITRFSGNSASSGGALSIENGSTVEITNGYFTANSADSAGGAVYLRGAGSSAVAVLRSNTADVGNKSTLFRGNSVDGASNALYLDDYSSAYFNTAAGTSVEMYDGITGRNNTTTYFEVSGTGDFNLYGTFDTLDLTILTSGKFNLMPGSLFNADTLHNASGARFSMQNGVNDVAYMKTLNNNGTLAFDILPGQNNKNDQIIVAEDLNLNSSTLEVKADSLTDNNFRKRIYRLINYDTYTGSFGTLNIDSPVQPVSSVIGYGDAYANWVTLSLFGNRTATEFGQISGETFNQNEAAKALDKISETVVDNDPWDLVLADIEAYDDDGIKNILTHLAGYFLPNVIRNAAADSPNNEIYDRIKNHCRLGHTISNGFWIQARGGVESFYENGNSPGDYKDTSIGAMAGYDRFMEDINLMLGIYGRLNSDSIEQGKHKADGTKKGIGVYGGYIKEDWELKGLTLLSFDSFDTKRYVDYADATAEADIKTTTLSFDVEGALKYDMTFNTQFRPYAGLELANAHYGAFRESGAGMFNLDVESGNYLRTAGRVGAGLHYEEDIWYLYANLEGKYLFSGTEPEITNAFEGTNASFRTRGAEEGALEIGGGVGASVRLTEELKLFANANYYGAENYQNIYGNIGLRYTFCNPLSLKSRTEPEPYYYEEPVPPAAAAEPEPVMPRSEDIDMSDETVVERQKLEAMQRRAKPMLKSYSLNMASFAVGKSDLTDAAKKDIAREAEEIKQFNFKRIIIEGHTDSTGSDELNKELSKARAKAVFDEFASHGIAEEKMFYIGFGPTMPRDTNKTSEGRANNRRVEIFVE